MNKKICLLSFLLLTLVFTSCEETKEVGKYDNWRARNEAFIDSIANVYATQPNHGGLDTIHMVSYPGIPIYFKEKTPVGDAGVQDVMPIYTDVVSTYYKGSYINKEMFDGTFDGANPSVDFSNTASLTVGGLVTGMTEVLQRTKIGQRREIYIPWQYGYGSTDQRDSYSGTVTIRAYTTLIFDVQVLSILQ